MSCYVVTVTATRPYKSKLKLYSADQDAFIFFCFVVAGMHLLLSPDSPLFKKYTPAISIFFQLRKCLVFSWFVYF
jgi:hypothetical protein